MTGTTAVPFIVLLAFCSLALMALEAFIPGVSLSGIGGVLLIGVAAYIGWQSFGPITVLVLLVLWGTATFFAMRAVFRSMKSGRLSKSGVFLKNESAPAVHTSRENAPIAVGSRGITRTALRPAGIAEISGKRVHVSASGAFVEVNEEIEVIRAEGSFILVAPVKK